jgi:flavin-dependent dehydrogenase
MANIEYDAVIVGAGPAGLAVGSELASRMKVLIVDRKEDIASTDKVWLVPDRFLDERHGNAPEIRPFARGQVLRFTTQTAGMKPVAWQANQKYWYLEEHQVLRYWDKLARERGAEIRLDCFFRDMQVKDDRVVIQTSGQDDIKTVTAKLLIDASGYRSPIRRKYRKEEPNLWWSVSGAVLEMPGGLGELPGLGKILPGDYMLWGTFRDSSADPDQSMEEGRPVLEYEVFDEHTCFFFIFYLREQRMDADDMQAEFLHVLRHEQATLPFHDAIVKEWKHGWYPSGGLNSQKQAEDRVAFIGDAGCWTSPCGWGMSFILANYKRYARELAELIENDRLGKRDLQHLAAVKVPTGYQVLLDQVVTHFLSHASANLLNDFIGLFGENSPLGPNPGKCCEDVFTLNVEDEEALFMIKTLAPLLAKDPRLMKILLRCLTPEDYALVAELVGEFVKKEAAEDWAELLRKKSDSPGKLEDGAVMDGAGPSFWTRLRNLLRPKLA